MLSVYKRPVMNFSHIDDRLTYYNSGIQLWEYLKGRICGAADAGRRVRGEIGDAVALENHVRKLRAHFLDRIGGLPVAGDLVKAEYFGETREEGLTIQNLTLEVRPGVRATANLYLPDGGGRKMPAVLFLCGHSLDGKMYPRYQTICRILASRGLVVLALDPTGQGERWNYYDPVAGHPVIRPATGDHEYCGFQCLLQGHNLCRYMLHDAMRAVDFLANHPQVDAARLGITGNSGGGTQTCLMMLLDERLAAAAPGTFVSSRQTIFDSGYSQDSEQIWRGFAEAGYDHADLLLSFAPKPLCVLSVEYDFFPIEGTRSTLSEARRFWDMFDRGGHLRLVEDQSVHGYTDKLGEAAADFFAEVFDCAATQGNVSRAALPENRLWATRSGQVLADFPESKTIFDENRIAFAAPQENAEEGLEFLRKAVFKDRNPVDLNLRVTQSWELGGITAFSGFWWSQEGLLNSGILLRPSVADDKSRPVTIALWEDGSKSLRLHEPWIRREIAAGRAVLVLNVTGMGPLEPYRFHYQQDLKEHYGTFFRINDDLLTLGDSFAALRTYDVLRCLDALGEWSGLDVGDVRLRLHGPYGIYGTLAAALDDRIGNVQWISPAVPWRELIQSKFYNDRDVKSLIVPGLIRLADWKNLVPKKKFSAMD